MKHRLFTRLSLGLSFLCLTLFPDYLAAVTNCNHPDPGSPGQLSPAADCLATIDALLVIAPGTTGNGPYQFVVRDAANNLIAVGTGSVEVDLSNYLNQPISVQVTDTVEQSSCTSHFFVEDKLPPTLTCPDDEIVCTASTAPANIAAITFDDNCDDDVSPTFVDVPMLLGCAGPHIGKITRNYTVMDASVNTTTCEQEILILRADITDVEFPPTDTIACGEIADTSITGRPSIDGRPIEPGGFCNIAVGLNDVDTLEICGEAILIFREWTIVNECTGQIAVDTQRIFVLDEIPPLITCPDPDTVFTDPLLCSADVFLAFPNVVEECSSFEITAQILPFGVGFFYNNLPTGTHVVTYTSTDDCGLFSTCQTTITVEDNETPTAVCDQVRIVAVPSNGIATLTAASFDDGSTDNCSPLTFLVSRDGGPFLPTVDFTCDDVGPDSVMVTLKVIELLDTSSFNLCMNRVVVQDKLPPLLACPADQTVDCQAYQDGLVDFGTVVVFDNCGADLDSVETEVLDVCSTGTLTRVFTATDPNGNVASCTQVITVENLTPFDGTGIIFPPDYTATQACIVASALAPGNLPAGFNFPTLPSTECAMLAVSHSDQLFYFDYPACYKIVRTWKVIDWCQYTAGNPNVGIWQDQQVIVVMDTTPPVIGFCPPDISVSLSANCSPANVNLQPVLAQGTCANEDVTITNNSPFATSSGANASGFYPAGVHTVTFTATDGCGNTATCQTTITVADLLDPTPYCKNGLIGELQAMPNFPIMVVFNAHQLNFQSFDNCTAAQDLQFTMRGVGDPGPAVPALVLSCADTGVHEVEIWVTDEAGNNDFCVTTITVQDNMNLCTGSPLVAGLIGGAVQTTMGDVLPDVHVDIPAMGMGAMTDELGGFTFQDLSVGSNYLLEPWKNDDPLNGITTFDLVLMSRHVLNIAPLNDPYKLIAADVNNSGSVTTADILELRKLVLQIYDEFPNNQSWRFVRADYEFPNPDDPFDPPYPEHFNVPNHDEDDVLNADFVAVKIGDLNGSASPGLLGTGDRSRESLAILVEDREIAAGEEFTVPVRLENASDLLALQFTLEFETDLELQGIEKGELSGGAGDKFETTHLAAGIVTGTWYHTAPVLVKPDDVLFSLRFRSQRAGRLGDMLALTSRYTQSLAYTDEGLEQDLDMHFQNPSNMQTSFAFQLHQNQPNPFKKVTHIGFTLPSTGPAKLTIYDLSGKILQTWEQTYSQGYHEVSIQRSELPTGGVLFYQLETPTNTATKKMILLQ